MFWFSVGSYEAVLDDPIYHEELLEGNRKLAWAGLESTTTEFRSDVLTDWAIKPCVQLVLKANFAQL